MKWSYNAKMSSVYPSICLSAARLAILLNHWAESNQTYVFPCVILFLCFSVLLVLRVPRLGKRELILVLFVRLFALCLFRFVGFLFLFLLGSGKGCGLWLWHSLDFSLTFFAAWLPSVVWVCKSNITFLPSVRHAMTFMTSLRGKCLREQHYFFPSICPSVCPSHYLFVNW